MPTLSRVADRNADVGGPVIGVRNQAFYDPLLTTEEAAALAGMSERGFANMRYRGGGPRFVRISARCVRYRRSDLIEWIEQRVVANTVMGVAQ